MEPLVTQGQRYHLQTDLFAIDVASCRAHLGRAATLPPAEALVEYERALALYRGALFGAEPFDWAVSYRQEQEALILEAVRSAAGLAAETGDAQQALRFYRAILAHDPIDEEASRNLMRCYAGVGDTNGVRKVYKTLITALRRELDDPQGEPLPESKRLFEELIAG